MMWKNKKLGSVLQHRSLSVVRGGRRRVRLKNVKI
jgi:hypothetical protein